MHVCRKFAAIPIRTLRNRNKTEREFYNVITLLKQIYIYIYVSISSAHLSYPFFELTRLSDENRRYVKTNLTNNITSTCI